LAANAIASISTLAFFGRVLTATVDLAGRVDLKYVAYASLNDLKSSIFSKNTNVFETLSKEEPFSLI
jgi:hypothetical protein